MCLTHKNGCPFLEEVSPNFWSWTNSRVRKSTSLLGSFRWLSDGNILGTTIVVWSGAMVMVTTTTTTRLNVDSHRLVPAALPYSGLCVAVKRGRNDRERTIARTISKGESKRFTFPYAVDRTIMVEPHNDFTMPLHLIHNVLLAYRITKAARQEFLYQL